MLEKLYSSSIIDESAKLFKNIRCVNSSIGRQCCIGDDCDIDALFMEEKSQLGRRNLVRNSTIGRGSYTGTNTLIYNTDIGRYCSIAWNVSIGGENHEYNHVSCYTDYWYQRTFGLSSPCQKQVSKRTSIGNDVWIAAGANILGGVIIGNGCVIGAGCVVNRDMEPYSIVVGVPGKQIKKRFDEETIKLLEELKWWNWSDEEIVSNIDFLRDIPTPQKIRKLFEKT